MKDQSKTSQKLIQELDYLRQKVAELEQSESDHNRAEDALQASEELLRVLAENSPSMIYLLDARGYVRFVNEKSAAQFGMKADAIIGRNVRDLFPERIAEQYMQSLQKVAGNGETIHSELSEPVPTGKRWDDAHIAQVRDKNGAIIAVLGISHDITDQKEAEKALRKSEEKYRALASSVDSMYLVDRECRYLFMNEGHRLRLGLPLKDIVGRKYGDFHSEEDSKGFAEKVGEVIATGKAVHQERWSERDGRCFLHTFTSVTKRSLSGEISEVVVVSKDITERKRVEQQLIETLQQLQETKDMLIQFEKHAAIGRLAGGVAHEILNPASIISSRLQFLEEENLSEQARENLRVCREQIQRIVKISQDLRQSSAKQPGMLVGCDLRHVIDVGLQMTERRIKEDHVQVEYHPPPEVIPVKMERDRVVKVMVNLILNACDAMTGNQTKLLIITVNYPEVSSKNPSILLIVADNGHGIPAGNLDRIFEPFFTTKDPGKGTGLGLSVCKGIIQEHGGTIHAENNDMGGASFIVELPLYYP